jgi:hypothetical protein
LPPVPVHKCHYGSCTSVQVPLSTVLPFSR